MGCRKGINQPRESYDVRSTCVKILATQSKPYLRGFTGGSEERLNRKLPHKDNKDNFKIFIQNQDFILPCFFYVFNAVFEFLETKPCRMISKSC